MPAEWERHERTLMGWPCRESSWGATLDQGRAEFAAVANAIAAFEPVTMVCANEAQAADARSRLAANVAVVVRPMDGSWLRDNGPIFVTGGGARRARHFRFNAWGERHAQRDRDARLGRTLAEDLGIPVDEVDVVLEGGAVSVDGTGLMVAPEGCVMHPSRNWYLDRDTVEDRLKAALGLTRLVWLGQGLAEDLARDPDHLYYGTDGHIDLFFCFIGPSRALMLKVDDGDPNAPHLAASRKTLEAAGIDIVDFPFMSGFSDEGRWIIAPYLNFYFCNGGVIVPVAGAEPDKDSEALAFLSRLFPSHEVVGVKMRAAPRQGGAIHCMTQQVPVA
ncbi:MAG: agmatine deiminase family protein [Hyphomicrobiales bacterium]